MCFAQVNPELQVQMDLTMPHPGISDDFNDASQLFQAIMDNMGDSVYFKDRQCRLMRVSRRLANSLGYENPEDLIGKTDTDLFGQEFGEKTRLEEMRIMETGQPIIGLVECFNRPDGTKNWTSSTKHPLRKKNGEIYGLFGITREINELKQIENDLQFLATHDVLTSLPNRFLLFDRLDQAIFRAQRYGTMIAVLFIDLDNFKKINDTCGHAAGDLLLVQIAGILQKHVRELDTVARIGGDEFVILMESIKTQDEVVQIADRIVRDINKGIDLYPTKPEVTVSIGISLYPHHGTTSNRLLGSADDAMYQAKKNKNTYEVFSMIGDDLHKN
ncbi:protein containing PAS domain S-box [Leptolinea tardivitalis]|nr:protein containing PAS domain S-box [Leptolinea tardivitalis]